MAVVGFLQINSRNNNFISSLEKQDKETDSFLEKELNRLITERASKLQLTPLTTLPIVSEESLGKLLIPLVKDDFEKEIEVLSNELSNFINQEIQKVKVVEDSQINIQNYETKMANIKTEVETAINKNDLLSVSTSLDKIAKEVVNVPVPKSYLNDHQKFVFSILLRYFIIKELANEQNNVVRKVLLQGIVQNLFNTNKK